MGVPGLWMVRVGVVASTPPASVTAGVVGAAASPAVAIWVFPTPLTARATGTSFTVRVTVPGALSTVPSLTVKVKLRSPSWPTVGVYVTWAVVGVSGVMAPRLPPEGGVAMALYARHLGTSFLRLGDFTAQVVPPSAVA